MSVMYIALAATSKVPFYSDRSVASGRNNLVKNIGNNCMDILKKSIPDILYLIDDLETDIKIDMVYMNSENKKFPHIVNGIILKIETHIENEIDGDVYDMLVETVLLQLSRSEYYSFFENLRVMFIKEEYVNKKRMTLISYRDKGYGLVAVQDNYNSMRTAEARKLSLQSRSFINTFNIIMENDSFPVYSN